MAISPQRLTIYLYSAHRAVIFAIAQLSCFTEEFDLIIRPTPDVFVVVSYVFGLYVTLSVFLRRRWLKKKFSMAGRQCSSSLKVVNPLKPIVVIKHSVPDRVKPSFIFLTSGHSDTQLWVSECPDIKSYNWWLNLVWHRMLYSCTHMSTVSVKGLTFGRPPLKRLPKGGKYLSKIRPGLTLRLSTLSQANIWIYEKEILELAQNTQSPNHRPKIEGRWTRNFSTLALTAWLPITNVRYA